MPRWKALPDELDPQVREFTGHLRGLVDRSGLSVAAVADRTGFSKTSWERYLGGRLLPPQRAVVALAEVTGAHTGHLTTMWELAERAWSRSEMRHDATMETIRVSQARAALEEFRQSSPEPDKGGRGRRRSAAPPATGAPGHAPGAPDTGVPLPVPPPGTGPDGDGRRGRRRRRSLFATGAVGAAAVAAGAVFLTGFGQQEQREDRPAVRSAPSPTASEKPDLPRGVKCSGADCTGKDPETMGCGGAYARTVSQATVGSALLEVRYSEVCGAAWARIIRGAPGDTVRIRSGKAAESDGTDAGTEAFTAMVAAASPDRARACATVGTGTSGCTVPDATAATPSGGATAPSAAEPSATA